MKFLSLVPAALTLFTLTAQAEPTPVDKNVCNTFFECGTFRGTGINPDGKSVTLTITTRTLGPNLAEFIYHEEGVKQAMLNAKLTVHFQDDGTFTMFFDNADKAFVAGLCSEKACSYTLSAYREKEEAQTVLGTFVFLSGDRMKFSMMALPLSPKMRNSTVLLKRIAL